MKTYYVANERITRTHKRLAFEGGSEQIRYDYSGFAEDNGTISAVTISVESGDSSISAESLAANVKSFTVTSSNAGKSLLKLTATAGANIDVQWLEIWVKSLTTEAVSDYGLVST